MERLNKDVVAHLVLFIDTRSRLSLRFVNRFWKRVVTGTLTDVPFTSTKERRCRRYSAIILTDFSSLNVLREICFQDMATLLPFPQLLARLIGVSFATLSDERNGSKYLEDACRAVGQCSSLKALSMPSDPLFWVAIAEIAPSIVELHVQARNVSDKDKGRAESVRRLQSLRLFRYVSYDVLEDQFMEAVASLPMLQEIHIPSGCNLSALLKAPLLKCNCSIPNHPTVQMTHFWDAYVQLPNLRVVDFGQGNAYSTMVNEDVLNALLRLPKLEGLNLRGISGFGPSSGVMASVSSEFLDHWFPRLCRSCPNISCLRLERVCISSSTMLHISKHLMLEYLYAPPCISWDNVALFAGFWSRLRELTIGYKQSASGWISLPSHTNFAAIRALSYYCPRLELLGSADSNSNNGFPIMFLKKFSYPSMFFVDVW